MVRPRYAVAAACLLALVAGGCASPEARHDILTIFFTGVPEPGAIPTERARALTPAERRAAELKARRRASFKPPETYSHGPNASNQCEVCHKQVGGEGAAGRRIGPEMVADMKDLCTGCHHDKDGAFAESIGLVAHKPSGDGMCVLCHDSHTARMQYMLKGETPVGLCMNCHARGKAAKTPVSAVHREAPDRDCLDCHNPHMGMTPRLLKADFDEWDLYDLGDRLAP